MTTSFQLHHGAMLLKYSGISFISGAVNHGFFSGARAVLTAAVGIVLFVLGAWLEHSLADQTADRTADARRTGLVRTMLWGTLLSIGLGFFTGGLQHFPDSPARSAWVVPLGFGLSVVALAVSAAWPWQRATTVYAVVASVWVCAGSWGAYRWLDANPAWAAGGHGHGAPADMVAQTVTRSVTIHMDDSMRFTPDNLDVQAGETIRFVVHNGGAVPHEWVLGTDSEIAAHAALMRQMASQPGGHAHGHGGGGAAITVNPGEMGELVVTFAKAGPLQMACLIPGHYEAGMKGHIVVSGAPAGAQLPRPVPHMGGHAH